MTTPRKLRRTSSGFVLPLVLVATAAFGLSALTLARAVNDDRVRIARLKADVDFERRAAIAQARLAHLVLTEPMGAGEVRVGADRKLAVDAPWRPSGGRSNAAQIRLDGALYALDVDAAALEASLQDEAGLVNVNGRSSTRLARLFAGAGLPGDVARGLADRVADYVDDDDVRRTFGAERREYDRAGAPPPRNASLSTVAELEAVLGWRADAGAATRRILARVRVAPPDASFNVNSAPPAALAAVLGLDARRTEELARRRAGAIVRNTDDLAALIGGGTQLDDLVLAAAPARTLRVRVRETPGPDYRGREMVSSLVLAEPGAQAPIGIGRRIVYAGIGARSEDDRATPLPTGGPLLAR